MLTLFEHSLISFTEKEPKDWMVPSKWGTARRHRHHSREQGGSDVVAGQSLTVGNRSIGKRTHTRHNRATDAVW